MNIIATDPRDDFEKVFPLPKHVIRCGNGYACTEYNAWGAYEFIHKWEGWRAAKLGDGSTAAPAVQADQLSGNNEQVSQPTLREGLAAIRNLGPIDAGKIQAERDALNEPDVPDGYALVPIKLTAENGAKGLLSGEFSETKFISCPECFGDDECETCDGSGRIEITVPVSWTTIKEIWAKGVAHFAAAPKQEAE